VGHLLWEILPGEPCFRFLWKFAAFDNLLTRERARPAQPEPKEERSLFVDSSKVLKRWKQILFKGCASYLMVRESLWLNQARLANQSAFTVLCDFKYGLRTEE
jgi:hypothetical protein